MQTIDISGREKYTSNVRKVKFLHILPAHSTRTQNNILSCEKCIIIFTFLLLYIHVLRSTCSSTFYVQHTVVLLQCYGTIQYITRAHRFQYHVTRVYSTHTVTCNTFLYSFDFFFLAFCVYTHISSLLLLHVVLTYTSYGTPPSTCSSLETLTVPGIWYTIWNKEHEGIRFI